MWVKRNKQTSKKYKANEFMKNYLQFINMCKKFKRKIKMSQCYFLFGFLFI